MTVEILRCPRHATFWAIAVNDFRITPSKCCGAWSTVTKWTLDGRRTMADIRKALKQ